jgi:WD40 repeat protein
VTGEARLIGVHRVQGVLGRGGMGTVLRARRPDGTEVAIKVLRATAAPAIARFEREVRLLASLGEGFVPVLETGTSDGFPYLVMPLLAGGTLEEKLRRGPLAVEEAVRLAATIARALGAAHAQGIVHRDLKPSNVLFTGDGIPLVSDLGLAKHFDREAPGASASVSLSKTGLARGTFGYMAPEQLKDAKNVGPPADVFSLGTILYECLTGSPPFQGDSHMAIVDATVRGHFEPLEKARPETPFWVRRVVLRALLPDPGARFADGAELARALEAGETGRRRLWPFVLVLPIAALILFLSLRRPRTQDAPPPAPPPPAALPAPFDRVEANGRLRLAAAWGDPAWDVTGGHALVFTPDGHRLLAAGEEALWVMDASSGLVEKTIEPGHGEVGACACSPDGTLVLLANQGRPPPPGGRFQPYPSGPPCVQLWELASGRLVATLEEVASPSVAFSARGDLALATLPDGAIRVFSVATGKPVATLGPAPGAPAGALATGPPGSTGDERVLAGGAAALRLWDPVSGTAVELEGHPGGTGALALLADRRRAVTGGNDGAVRIWDLATGAWTAIAAHQGPVSALAVSSDETTLVTSGRDGAIEIWDLATRAARATIPRPAAYDGPGLDYFKPAGPVAISPDGKRVVASAWDYRLRVYDRDGKLQAGGALPASQVPGLAVDPRARFVATGGRDGSVLVRDQKGALVKSLEPRVGEVWSVAFSQNGERLAAAGWSGELVVWDVPSWREAARFGVGGMLFAVALDAAGRRVAVSGWNNATQVRDVTSGEVLASFPGYAPWLRGLAFSGDRLVGANGNDTAVLWDLATNKALATFKVEHELQSLAVSADGKLLVTASNDEQARVFALSGDGAPLRALHAGKAKVTGCALSREGGLVATSAEDRTVRLWDGASGSELGRVSLGPIADRPVSVAFAPDGGLLVTTDRGLVLRFEVR